MTSPMMQQYLAAKRQHSDGLLLFRMGDFYELFFEDAEKASSLLGLTLTSRSKGEGAVPMAGVPCRNVDTYVNRLIRLGQKVVICDQVQEAADAKGIVDRAVTRVVTPGTVLEEEGLDEKKENWLCGVVVEKGVAGLAYADLSTGAFLVEGTPRLTTIVRCDGSSTSVTLAGSASSTRIVACASMRLVPATPSSRPSWRNNGSPGSSARRSATASRVIVPLPTM